MGSELFAPPITLYQIGRKWIGEYSKKMSYDPATTIKQLDDWINLDPKSLPFGDYAQIGQDIDELWMKSFQLSTEWMNFSSIAKRLVTLGVSEAEVERLFSQQKSVMGYHMTNLGTKTLNSRLTVS